MLTISFTKWEQALAQAKLTSQDYLSAALAATENLPKGVDRATVIAAYMQAAAQDFHTAAVVIAIQNFSNMVEDASQR